MAKETINNLIPHILKTNKRAQRGVNASTLIHYSPSQDPPKRTSASVTSKSSTSATDSLPAKVKVSVIPSDTYDACKPSSTPINPAPKLQLQTCFSPPTRRRCPKRRFRPKETLCLRSTLYPSLKHQYYRTPPDAAIYTPDVLVFRSSSHAELPKSSWYYTDVISVAAPRQPDTVMGAETRLVYDADQDREAMFLKARLIF